MGIYIDADALKAKKRFYTKEQRFLVWMTDIYKAPSIDIVFCKDCRFWKKVSNCMCKRPMGYCDEGERIESTEITYQNCSAALLKMWMDNVLTDGEYNRIMDNLNIVHGKECKE